jgi:hypothetical protein
MEIRVIFLTKVSFSLRILGRASTSNNYCFINYNANSIIYVNVNNKILRDKKAEWILVKGLAIVAACLLSTHQNEAFLVKNKFSPYDSLSSSFPNNTRSFIKVSPSPTLP